MVPVELLVPPPHTLTLEYCPVSIGNLTESAGWLCDSVGGSVARWLDASDVLPGWYPRACKTLAGCARMCPVCVDTYVTQLGGPRSAELLNLYVARFTWLRSHMAQSVASDFNLTRSSLFLTSGCTDWIP
jgi:hypothetical protein